MGNPKKGVKGIGDEAEALKATLLGENKMLGPLIYIYDNDRFYNADTNKLVVKALNSGLKPEEEKMLTKEQKAFIEKDRSFSSMTNGGLSGALEDKAAGKALQDYQKETLKNADKFYKVALAHKDDFKIYEARKKTNARLQPEPTLDVPMRHVLGVATEYFKAGDYAKGTVMMDYAIAQAQLLPWQENMAKELIKFKDLVDIHFEVKPAPKKTGPAVTPPTPPVKGKNDSPEQDTSLAAPVLENTPDFGKLIANIQSVPLGKKGEPSSLPKLQGEYVHAV